MDVQLQYEDDMVLKVQVIPQCGRVALREKTHCARIGTPLTAEICDKGAPLTDQDRVELSSNNPSMGVESKIARRVAAARRHLLPCDE